MRADTGGETPRWRPTDGAGRDVLLGLGVAAAAVAVAALLARAAQAADDPPQNHTDFEDPYAPAPKPRSRILAAVWPPVVLALTASGLRIWRSPGGRARTQALTLWGMAQALNTTWMALGPRRLGGRLATTVASMGATGAYLLSRPQHRQARRDASAPGSPGTAAIIPTKFGTNPPNTVH